ncbi:MAG: glutamate ligase domain-containing protein, partial [Acidaminococcaceae bacterium]
TIKALESFDGHIILLAGGRDKKTDLTEMMSLIKIKTDALILMGEAKERFSEAAAAAGVQNIHVVETIDDAVMLAHRLARAPQIVLLSPACSSFDMFENFPHRGRYFKELVRKLVK